MDDCKRVIRLNEVAEMVSDELGLDKQKCSQAGELISRFIKTCIVDTQRVNRLIMPFFGVIKPSRRSAANHLQNADCQKGLIEELQQLANKPKRKNNNGIKRKKELQALYGLQRNAGQSQKLSGQKTSTDISK